MRDVKQLANQCRLPCLYGAGKVANERHHRHRDVVPVVSIILNDLCEGKYILARTIKGADELVPRCARYAIVEYLRHDALGPQSEFTSLVDDGAGSDGPMETKTHTHGEDRCHSTEA